MWLTVDGLFTRGTGIGRWLVRCVSALSLWDPPSWLGLTPLRSLWAFSIPVVKTRHRFPCVKEDSSRAVSAPPHFHSPSFGQSCKAGPWESPAPHSDPLVSALHQEAVLPAPLSQLRHTRGGQSQSDSPLLPPEPSSHFPRRRPPPLSAFQSSKQLEGDPFLLSSACAKKKSESMRKKAEGGPSWWWWSSGLARSHLWSPGY